MPKFLHSYTDRQLLTALADGKEEAFTELYNRYWDKLLFVAGSKFRDLAIAEEIVQDIFLDLWKRRTVLHITGDLDAYLAVSVKYKVINAQARLKRSIDFQRYLLFHQTQHDSSTEDYVSFHDLKDRLSSLVAKLPERCRITYQLSKEAGLSQKEIATRLSISEKAVEANLSRALKYLRNFLGQRSYLLFF